MDLTDPHSVLFGLLESHGTSLAWLLGYLFYKVVVRFGFGRSNMTVSEMSVGVWDPACLVHNIVSVLFGLHAVLYGGLEWDPSETCSSISDSRSLVLLLQACHCVSDFVVFLPQMINEPVILIHHIVLLVVSLILPSCNGCYWTVIAFSLAEAGSLSIAMDAEYRKLGYPSTGLWRVVIFGGSRLINLGLLFKIWQATPKEQIWQLFILSTAGTSSVEVLRFNFPVCLITAVGGSFFMLCANGLTWYRMWKAYLRYGTKINGRKEH
mmetsp:Transcript_16102/g.29768  ORF Transcript_16102/g.29768 Transcript_16102/m.29768 type:complete len:266 (+) Transcript_16102:74-871(+)